MKQQKEVDFGKSSVRNCSVESNGNLAPASAPHLIESGASFGATSDHSSNKGPSPTPVIRKKSPNRLQPLTREDRHRPPMVQAPLLPNSVNPLRSGGFSTMNESLEMQPTSKEYQTNYQQTAQIAKIVPQPNLQVFPSSIASREAASNLQRTYNVTDKLRQVGLSSPPVTDMSSGPRSTKSNLRPDILLLKERHLKMNLDR